MLMEMYEVAPVVENLENSYFLNPQKHEVLVQMIFIFNWVNFLVQNVNFPRCRALQPLIHHHPSIMIQGETPQP